MCAPDQQCELKVTIKDIHISVIIFAPNVTVPVDSYACSMSPSCEKNASNDSSAPTIGKQASHLLQKKK